MHHNTYLNALVLYLLTWIISGQGTASPVIFPVYGNVYPLGYYNVTIMVGNPPKPYFLDIDTGSDFTWLQCDANGDPCTNCFKAPHTHYKPDKLNQVPCNEPICQSFQPHGDDNCLRSPETNEQCDYEVQYADHVSSLGVLVWDNVFLDLANGTSVTPRLAFGCGYDQEVHRGYEAPYVDGILGLGKGGPSILTQLQTMGVTRNVLGHCFSNSSRGGGGGYLFFGDIPMLGIAWTPILTPSDHYHLGLADLQYSGRQTTTNIVKGLEVIFDSGSTYTYFNARAYGALVDAINEGLKGKKLEVTVNDKSLPVCWKRRGEPFKSIDDAINYFKPLALAFTNGKHVQFELSPESYLVVTEKEHVCLGILNGSEVGLGDTNIIGDISMQDKLVIYDNERNQVGWAPANCNTNPKP
ncbi:hypothetical protein OROGR_021600 [Orobanche gracilis]